MTFVSDKSRDKLVELGFSKDLAEELVAYAISAGRTLREQHKRENDPTVVYVPVSRVLLSKLTGEWSDPVQVLLNDHGDGTADMEIRSYENGYREALEYLAKRPYDEGYREVARSALEKAR